MEPTGPQTESPPRKRRWFQYSLRSMLILMTLFALWLGMKTHGARQQAQAVAALRAVHATIHYDWEEGPQGFTSDRSPPGPKWLRDLVGDDFFQEVKWVQLRGSAKSVLPCLKGLGGLETLIIIDDSIDDEAIELVADLRQVQFLNIMDTQVTDEGLRRSASLPCLRGLLLAGPTITGACLADLGTHTRLERLDLTQVQITPEQVADLGRLPSLKELQLYCPCLTDEHLSHLPELPHLRCLELGEGRLSMRGLEHLKNLPALEYLHVPLDTGDGDVALLRELLPRCQVE